ncbi:MULTISPECIES: hypothetical protein [Enterobacteriaceae]|uniref:hypothetical protein n=1 Tax=Enterobacteriaceae TaxID=543 RepID=UPI000579FF47|nr:MULTISPECIES: hypothetical protein [Enterobacteriaceae]
MTKNPQQSLAWLKHYWSHQQQDMQKSEIKLEPLNKPELFDKAVDKITIGQFYQWLLSEGYIFTTKDNK